MKVHLTMNNSTDNYKPKNPSLCCVFSTQSYLPCNFCSYHCVVFCLSPKYVWVNVNISKLRQQLTCGRGTT